MQKAVFPIQSHADITKAINFMHTNYNQAINEGKPLVVVIDQKQEDRSKAQNRLLHMWFGQIARHTGDTPEAIKFEMKKKYLAKIYVRDSEEAREAYDAVIGYRDVVQSLDGEDKKIHTVKYNRVVRMFIQDHVKSSKATKKQFSEFCDKIHAFASVELGVYLSCPDDLKYLMEMS